MRALVVICIAPVLGCGNAAPSPTTERRDSALAYVSASAPREAEAMEPRPTPALGRAALGRAIVRALEGTRDHGEGLPVVADAPPQPRARPQRLDRDFVRARMMDSIVPVAQRCYDERLAEEPGLVARVDMMFTVAGAPGIGAVVEDATITGASVEGPLLTECIRQASLALTLVAPPAAGRTRVGYTFGFEPPSGDAAG